MTDVENLQRFEWLPVCCDDSVEYQMQMCRKKGHEFKVVRVCVAFIYISFAC